MDQIVVCVIHDLLGAVAKWLNWLYGKINLYVRQLVIYSNHYINTVASAAKLKRYYNY